MLVVEGGRRAWRCNSACGEEAHDGSTREELFLAFWEDVGIGKITSSTKGPWIGLAKLFVDLGDGILDDVVGTVVQFSENQRIGEGFGEALVVDHRAKDSKGSGSPVLIVENGVGRESFESLWVMWFWREVW